MRFAGPVVAAHHVDTTLVGDRAVLFHRGSGEATVLNPTGTFLWAKVQEKATIDQLFLGLQSTYDLTEEQAKEDVLTFLEELRSSQLLKESSA